MNIETTKLELINLLLQTQKESLLAKLKIVFEEDPQEDWWNELPKEVQQEIEIGLEQANKGNLVNHETVMQHFDKWH